MRKFCAVVVSICQFAFASMLSAAGSYVTDGTNVLTSTFTAASVITHAQVKGLGLYSISTSSQTYFDDTTLGPYLTLSPATIGNDRVSIGVDGETKLWVENGAVSISTFATFTNMVTFDSDLASGEATIAHDGDSFNIIANANTASDMLEMTASTAIVTGNLRVTENSAFGDVTVDPDAIVIASQTFNTAFGNVYGMRFIPTVESAASLYAISAEPSDSASAIVRGGTSGFVSQPQINHTGGTTVGITSFNSLPSLNANSAGSITSMTHFLAGNPTKDGTSTETIGTLSAVRLAEQTRGSVNWQIISLGGDWALDGDSDKIYWGEGQDSYVEFDGDSMNIVANATTATDDLEITADLVNLGATPITTTGLLTATTALLGSISFSGNTISSIASIIDFSDENLHAEGNIVIDSDSSVFGVGAAGPTTPDATVGFDGDSMNIVANAVTASDDLNLTADSFNFNMSPTVNYLISAQMAATDERGLFIDGATNDYTGTGVDYGWAMRFSRDHAAGAGTEPQNINMFQIDLDEKHSNADLTSNSKINSGLVMDEDNTATWKNDGTNTRSYQFRGNNVIINNTATFDANSTGRMDNTNIAYRVIGNATPTFEGGGHWQYFQNFGLYVDFDNAPVIGSGNLAFYDTGISIDMAGTTTGVSRGYGLHVLKVQGYDTNWAYYNDSTAGNFMGDDSIKSYFGTGSDSYAEFDGDSLNLIANAVTSTNKLEVEAAWVDLVIEAASEDGIFIDGDANPFNVANTKGTALDVRRTYDWGTGAVGTAETMYLRVTHESSGATMPASKTWRPFFLNVENTGSVELDAASNRNQLIFPMQALINDTGTWDTSSTGQLGVAPYAIDVDLNLTPALSDSGDNTPASSYNARGLNIVSDLNPASIDGTWTITQMGVFIDLTGTSEGTSTNRGIHVSRVTGADLNYGYYDTSDATWWYRSDTGEMRLGEGSTDFNIYYVGGTNRATIESLQDLDVKCGTDYTLELQETVWNDANVGAAVLSLPASSFPDEDEFVDEGGTDTGITTLAYAIGEASSGSIELPHDYKEGTDIYFHIHFQGITAPGGGTDNIKFECTYTVGKVGETLDAATTISDEDAFTTQYDFAIMEFAAITGTNFNVGDQFLFNIERVAASADDYAGDCLLATVGIHYETDTLGSRQKTSK